MPLRLKSLELHGYKTFASRTQFLFADTVTAIVGPNGSGKSNIADSLRWVLGEQSYGLLRAKKTEDMIFSGSEQRARAGMAAATIIFDNCDNWLPIDFSEVAITRRAYRDGQNEYLINGQRVRLKDVSELLAQSGLSERTYTIIGQGLVDAALALKAEERRRLFEEAAGIGLHRARREEALKRLETTRRNLERVQDILAELQPRLRSLERQARRSQEYEQIKADLQVLLREWYGYHWHHAQQELARAREFARGQEAGLARARDEQIALDEQLSALRERVQGLRASLNSWHRQSGQLHNRREMTSRELAVAEERLRSLVQQQDNTRAELARLEEEASLQRERQAAAQKEVDRLGSELSEARAQAEAARKKLSARQAERLRAEKDLQAARGALSGLNARLGNLQARLSERQAQAERAAKGLEAARQAVAAAEAESRAAAERWEAAQDAQRRAEAEREAADERLQEHRKRVAAAEARRKEAQDRRAAVDAEAARLKAQLDVLEQAERALSGYAGGTRLLLQAARQNRLQGTRGALSSFLEVPAELETAIAAALGEYLDSVLVDGEPEPALDLLGKAAARGVLLPLRSLHPGEPLTAHGADDPQGTPDHGVLGVAADLVKVVPDYRPAVDLLLGDVLVVRDRAAARQALARLSRDGSRAESRVRAVTLQGEVFLASGPVLAGAAGAGASGQSVLSRQRQRRELVEQVQEAQEQRTVAQEQLQALDTELRELQAEGERLGQAQRQARQAEEKASLAANGARLAHQQAEKQSNWQAGQLKRLQEEISRGEGEARAMEAERKGLEAELTQARERVRDANTALAALTLDEFQSQVNHWNTQAAVAERVLGDGKARQRELQTALERAMSRQVALQRRLEDLELAQDELQDEKARHRAAESQVAAEIEALRQLIDPAETELETLEGRQAELEAAEAAARQALSIAEHHHAQARIALAKRQEALDTLRRRVEDDFGLVQFEYAEEVSGPTPLPLGGLVEQLPVVSRISPEIEETIQRQRAQLRRMGAINPDAQKEYEEVKERHAFLVAQVGDLNAAETDVRQVIAELDALMQQEFRRTFEAVAAEFKEIFIRLFGGGAARLVLTDPDDLTDTGIDIEARLPGRRTQGLSLLSGGERSLTATALVFALLKVSPTPFCVLDEVDAMLDEANVGRFRDLLRELSRNTQFVVVTHNRNTVQAADIIYGVTMGRDSASQVISLKLDEVAEIVDSA